MAIAGNDSYGSFLDTGANTFPAARTNVEQEFHTALEIDSGAKYASIALVSSSHIPHRAANSPR